MSSTWSQRIPWRQPTLLYGVSGREVSGLFWVREDAINESKDIVNLDVLKPTFISAGLHMGEIS